MRKPRPPTRSKEEPSPITQPSTLPRCPECGGRHTELASDVPDRRPAWYCIDCCFSWFM